MIKNRGLLILATILLIFLSLFILKSVRTMITVPFYDFDEAHRAEKAKKMKEYVSFLVPLTGSPQDRTVDLRVPVKENPDLFLYYHPERPPLVYWLMIASTSIFGSVEWAYRLPSFLMSLLTMAIFIFFAFKKNLHLEALFIGLLTLVTSVDIWLSGQYAQLDTSLTFFLTLYLLTLISYVDSKKNSLLLVSGISFSLAVLSKGQPAIIFIFPLIFLVLSKKMRKREAIRFFAYSGIILIPWLILLNIYFGLGKVLKIFTEFAAYTSIIGYSFTKAPFFWYVRWWWDTLRPGWTIFLSLLIFDIYYRNLNWKKLTLLSFIFGSLLLFSVSANKIWWYVLPLVPAIAFYIYLSSASYLEHSKNRLINLSVAIILASLPIFYAQINKITLIYGFAMTILTTTIIFIPGFRLSNAKTLIFTLALFISLGSFLLHFPKIVPYHYNTKAVAGFFSGLPGKKCLWVYDMPPETALFYSNAGEILTLTNHRSIFPSCHNFLITPAEIGSLNLPYESLGNIYYVKNRPIVYQKGKMKLVRLNDLTP